MNETPTICASNYASGDFDWNQLTTSAGQFQLQQPKQFLMGNAWSQFTSPPAFLSGLQNQPEPETKTYMPEPTRRIIQVFIADPNPNVPLEESVLFKGDQKLTDLTDTELFFEVPISQRLAEHNAKRVKWLDKESTKRAGKDVTLDPVKIRELKMVVVTIAQF